MYNITNIKKRNQILYPLRGDIEISSNRDYALVLPVGC